MCLFVIIAKFESFILSFFKGVYYLKEYYLSPELFPPYVPEAEFEIKGTFFGNENGIILPCVDWFLKGRVALTRNQFWQNKKAQPAGLI